MTESRTPDLFAADGGGTACRFALLHDGCRYEAQLGAANVSTDRDGAIETLRDGIARLCDAAGIDRSSLGRARAHFGLAGAVSEADAKAVADALAIGRVVVADDRMSSMTGALGNSDGAVIAVGTGSFVGRCVAGACRFVGGWGPTLGDEASGAWLGRTLLAEVLHAVDGLTAASDLTAATLKRFGDDPNNIVRFARTAPAGAFAEHAPRIVAAARNGDPAARRLMVSGAGYLTRALGVLGWQPGEKLCLLGGVGPHYADYLDEDTAASIADPLGSALDGALTLAARIGAGRGAA